MVGLEEAKITFDVAAVVTAIGTASGAIIAAWATRRRLLADASKVQAEADKIDADADEITLNAATSMIKRLENEIRKMSFRIDSLEEELGIERARSEDTRRKYLLSLDRIVELEREVISLRKKVETQDTELSKYRGEGHG
jgi:chromosome segregation ATPase